MREKLIFRFDMNTIQHLGISMYTTLPPVIAELVSNAWDADANEVYIELYDSEPEKKCIVVKDNGCGMSIKDIQNKFLLIGRNRRKEADTSLRGRKIIGRKGIGKLSMFGIANEIIVTTLKEENRIKYENKFILNLDEIKSSGNEYHPPHEIINEKTEEQTGTIIELRNLKRKSLFDSEKIAIDLARRFLIFDENFKVFIKYNNDSPVEITQEKRFEGINIEFKWEFPNSEIESEYEYKNDVRGCVYTAQKPVPEDLKGIYLMARGKLVHRNDFYGIRASDYAHAYLTGWLEVDFIDDNPDEDYISTNRQELIWEREDLQELRSYIQGIISFVTQKWRRKRENKKEQEVKEKTGIDIHKWVNSLDSVSKPLAKKLVNGILKLEAIETEKTAEMIEYIHEMFEFDSFKKMASELVADNELQEKQILGLLKKWEIVEAREMYKLSQIRIDTIRNFEKLIGDNAKEVPTMHKFFKKFPWLLDPKIMEFRDEITYSKLLKENYPEEDIQESDRRIDFLCTRLGGVFFIIELKRPNHKLKLKDLEQAKDYRTFIEEYVGNEFHEKVIAYLVVEKTLDDRKVKDEVDSLKTAQKIYIKTYLELLQNAKNYHIEFIEKYEKIRRKEDIDDNK